MALLGEPRCCCSTSPAPGCRRRKPSGGDRRHPLGAPAPRAIVVIEHDMALVRTLADHVFVLHNGSLLAEGSVAASRPTPPSRRSTWAPPVTPFPPRFRRRRRRLRRRRRGARRLGRRRSGRGALRHRPQRRRQEHAVEAVVRRAGVPGRQRPSKAGSAGDGGGAARARHQLLPAGAAGVRRPQRRDNLTLMRADRRLEAFEPFFRRFPARRAARAARGDALRGRGKLLSFARAFAEARRCAPRRAQRGRAVGKHPADGRPRRSARPPGARSWWSSRTWRSRRPWPAATSCSIRGGWCWPASVTRATRDAIVAHLGV